LTGGLEEVLIIDYADKELGSICIKG